MKRIFMLIILLTMVVSLGGCLWGFEGRGRDGGHDERGGGHEERGGGHDGGGERGGGHEERH